MGGRFRVELTADIALRVQFLARKATKYVVDELGLYRPSATGVAFFVFLRIIHVVSRIQHTTHPPDHERVFC